MSRRDGWGNMCANTIASLQDSILGGFSNPGLGQLRSLSSRVKDKSVPSGLRVWCYLGQGLGRRTISHPGGCINVVELMLAVLTARGAIATCKQAFRLVQLVGNGLHGNPAALSTGATPTNPPRHQPPPVFHGDATYHKLRRLGSLLTCGYCSLRGSAAKSFQPPSLRPHDGFSEVFLEGKLGGVLKSDKKSVSLSSFLQP